MGMTNRRLHGFSCLLVGHDMEQTDEYAHPNGYVVTERVCQRCQHREVARVGPKLEDYSDGIELPERTDVTDDGLGAIELPRRFG